MRNGIRLMLVATFVLASASVANAAEVKPTIITIPKMHCEGCAKKVTDQIEKVPGVEKVTADLKAKTIKVVARPDFAISPKALWEAVEKGDKNPTKLEGPQGTFTQKPAN